MPCPAQQHPATLAAALTPPLGLAEVFHAPHMGWDSPSPGLGKHVLRLPQQGVQLAPAAAGKGKQGVNRGQQGSAGGSKGQQGSAGVSRDQQGAAGGRSPTPPTDPPPDGVPQNARGAPPPAQRKLSPSAANQPAWLNPKP